MYSRVILLERIQLALLRGAAGGGAVLLSVWIWHRMFNSQTVVPWAIYYIPALLVGVLVMVVMWSTPARDPDSPIVGTVSSIGKGVAVVLFLMLAISFFYRSDSYSRGTFIVFVPLALAGLYLASTTHLGIIRIVNANVDASRRVIVVGYGEHGHRIAHALVRQPAYYSVVGYLDDAPTVDDAGVVELRRLGTTAHLDTVVAENEIDVVMIALTYADPAVQQELIGVCMAQGVDWKVVPPMLDLVLDHVELEYVGGLPLAGQRGSRLVGHNWYIKRVFDVVVAGLLLIILSPILLLAYLAVRVTSRGPAIYRQPRVGLRSRPFTLLKLRTMRVDASSEVHKQAVAEWILGREINVLESTGEIHKIKDDGRVTRVGRVLRVTSIDELPQLWNVVRGDMSLVGPRPPIAYEVDRYSEWHKRRLEVPPGVTGLWQVSGRNRLSFDEMVDLDIDYMEQWSLGLDVEILLRTLPAVLSDRGY